jgi:hypothetical protein
MSLLFLKLASCAIKSPFLTRLYVFSPLCQSLETRPLTASQALMMFWTLSFCLEWPFHLMAVGDDDGD